MPDFEVEIRQIHPVTPDWFRGPPFREPNSIERAEPWMPERARHDGAWWKRLAAET